MAKKIVFDGWEVGMRKIPFVKLLHEEAGLTLTDAKKIKDRLVDKGEIVELNIKNDLAADMILKKALELKVKGRLENA